MVEALLLRPGALDEFKHGRDLAGRQDDVVGGHGARAADVGRQARATATDGVNELGVAVVPGVPPGVVGRRAKRAVGILQLPVRFALQRCAVTGGAVLGINRFALLDALRVKRGRRYGGV